MVVSGTTVTTPNVLQVTQFAETPRTASISSNTVSYDLSLGTVFTTTSTANATTVNFNNAVAAKGNAFTLIITNNGTAFTWTWPAAVKWAAGLAPTLTGTNGKVDVFSFVTPDGGTTWYGFNAGQNF